MGFEFVTKLPTPAQIRGQHPISEKIRQSKIQRDQEIQDVFTGKSQNSWPSSGRAPLTTKMPCAIMLIDCAKCRTRSPIKY